MGSSYEDYGACGGRDGHYNEQSRHNGGIDFASTYYYDASGNQPAVSAPVRNSREGPRERHGTRASSRRSQRFDNAEQKNPEPCAAGEGSVPRREAHDRSRRKGEPFRYDRRPWNRDRVAPSDKQRSFDDRGWSDVPAQEPSYPCQRSFDDRGWSDVPAQAPSYPGQRSFDDRGWSDVPAQESSYPGPSDGTQCSEVADAAPAHRPQSGRTRWNKKSTPIVNAYQETSCPYDEQPQGHSKHKTRSKALPDKRTRRKLVQTRQRVVDPNNLQPPDKSPGEDLSQAAANGGVGELCVSPQGESASASALQSADDSKEAPHNTRKSASAYKAGRNWDFSSATHRQHARWDQREPTRPHGSRNHSRRKYCHPSWEAYGWGQHPQLERESSHDIANASECIQEGERRSNHKQHSHTYQQPDSSLPSCGSEKNYKNHQGPFTRQHYGTRKSGHSNHRSSSSTKSYPQAPTTNNASQKDRLTELLLSGEHECMVCCERIRGSESIWSCSSCYHIFHLGCARKWALSPAALEKEGGWRCPACQSTVPKVPDRYMCFCGKRVNPEWDRYGVPHSCGEMCGRSRGAPSLCVHRCNLQCHPGQCPPCSATVRRPCPCGKLTRQVRCSQEQEMSCGEPCGRLLNCGVHICESLCHADACDTCAHIVDQKCFCDKERRQVLCTQESNASREFSCGKECGRPLDCGSHQCTKVCHFGECGSCPLLPTAVTNCPCGKRSLDSIEGAAPRMSCVDSIPTCGSICGKLLRCGPKDSPHQCGAPCHEGPCPACPLSSPVRCRCGATSREVPCVELLDNGSGGPPEELCQRRCQKRRQCGRHKCLALCCVDMEHRCPLVCGKRLACGQHVCEEPCHRGNCPSCWNVSFEDLSCHCGSTSLSAPIACGTRPPECSEPCAREHSCGHVVTHSCHSDPTCPPCTALMEKWCFGHHEKRRAVPCFLEGLSCGRPCLRDLPCGQHQCQQTCHAGECPSQALPGGGCGQPCTTARPSCGHPCGEPCHPDTPCPPASTCKTLVSISCECSRRSEKLPCGSSESAQSGFHQLPASLLASKIQGLQLGESIDIGRTMALARTRPGRLECDEECAVLERNRRLASALQIQNADVSGRVGPPCYSDFLKDEARKNPSFMLSVHQTLTQLVQMARQSKQKSRSHCFPSMNREQRRAVHELAEFFGCETQSYDQEPFRNVVVTACKDRCRIPSGSVVEVVQRESAPTPQRKGPVPLVPQSRKRESAGFPPSAPLPLSATPATQPTSSTRPEEAPSIDYFNYDS